MSKRTRHAPYLLRRSCTWHLRFKLPTEIQSIADRIELRLSLRTSNARVAETRAASLYRYLLRLKRLARRLRMKSLTEQDAADVLGRLLEEMTEELERLQWADYRDQGQNRPEWSESDEAAFGDYDEVGLAHVRHVCEPEIREYRDELRRNRFERTAIEARDALTRLGYTWEPESPLTQHFCAELAKQRITFNEVLLARTEGDFRKERELLVYVRPRRAPATRRATRTITTPGIRVSSAWAAYFREKTAGRPQPDWSARTAAGQKATMEEFLEIIGDLPIVEVSRDVLMRYLEVISRLPKNRRKRYPEATIDSLANLDVPDAQRPSARTIKEKMTALGAFLRWCREVKGYLHEDPTRGVHIRADSRRYAPFSQQDLESLFYSREYLEGRHRRCWHFWVPLIALYTGARQTEIAQLNVADVVREDGIDILSISDSGEGQRVKTRAAIRKVPISEQLKSIGLLDYVDWLRDRPERRLFPDLEPGSRRAGERISRWFGDTYRKNCGIASDATGDRKVFHSFRHTAITKALGTGVPVQFCQQFFGHEKSILGETATYTHQFAPLRLKAVADALDWGLNHSAYANQWIAYAQS